MPLLSSVWQNPEIIANFTNKQWQILIRQARASYLLPTLGLKLSALGLESKIDNRVWLHFKASISIAKQQQQLAKSEINRLDTLFVELNQPAIVLKGCAYVLQQLPLSEGRLFSDIDLLFNKDEIQLIENQLWFKGYIPTKEDDYDKQYYRQWMHEIPPLQHINRKTVLDVHHNILPLTGKTQVNINTLLANKLKVEGLQQIYVLSHEGQILHSATHLFHEGEFDKGLRDLIDLEQLIKSYLATNGNLTPLIEQAKATNLGLPLFFATRYLKNILTIKLSAEDQKDLTQFAPKKFKLLLLDYCFTKVFTPKHSSCQTISKSIAEFILYIRAHLMRMPLRLLIPHLIKKSIKQAKNTYNKEADNI